MVVVIRSYYKPTTWYSSWGKKLQIRILQLRNLSMALYVGTPMAVTLVQQYIVGEEDTTLGQQYDVSEKGTIKAKTETI